MSQCKHIMPDGNRCQRAAKAGRDFCITPGHGGRAAVGPDAGNFRHGRYSRYLPEDLAVLFHESQLDEDLLGLRQEISLVETRIILLLQQVSESHEDALWPRLEKQIKLLEQAFADQDMPLCGFHLDEIKAIINSGTSERDAWTEMYHALEVKQRLGESERRRLLQMNQMISSEEALTLMGAIVASIRRHVQDPQVLGAISADIEGLVSSSAGRQSRPTNLGGQSPFHRSRPDPVDRDSLLGAGAEGSSGVGAVSASDASGSIIEG